MSSRKLDCCQFKITSIKLEELTRQRKLYCPSCSRTINTSAFEVNLLIDVKDVKENWFLGQITAKTSQEVTIHYIGWSNSFDEKITLANAVKRTAQAYSHVASLNNADLEVDSDVEVFSPLINRWRKAKIVSMETVGGKKRIRVDDVNSNWLDLDPAYVSLPGTHLLTIDDNEVEELQECTAPNGLMILAKDLSENDNVEAMEQISSQYALPNLEGFQLFESISALRLQIARERGSQIPEQLRFLDARAAAVLERSVLCGADNVNNFGFSFEECKHDIDDDDYTHIRLEHRDNAPSKDMTAYFGITTQAVNMLLSSRIDFREVLCDQWASIPQEHQQRLVLADILESSATKASTVATRRFLFAEAASLIEKVLTTVNIGEVRPICFWRLCRQYVVGLGIDNIEIYDRFAADMQSSEYLQLRSNPSGYLSLFKGLVASLSRFHKEGIQSSHALKYLDEACSQLIPAAMYWKSVLLFEGWGEKSMNRKDELIMCKDLLTTCSEFGFWKSVCDKRIEIIIDMLKLDYAIKTRHYPLTLYVFAQEMKDILLNQCDRMVLFITKALAKKKKVAGPKENGNYSELLSGVRERFILFKPSEENVSKEKNPMDEQINISKAMWLKQMCNNIFQADEDNKWTSDHAKELCSTFGKLNQALYDICKPFDGRKLPTDEAKERLDELSQFEFNFSLVDRSQHAWSNGIKKATKVYDGIPVMNRFLSEQVETFDCVDEYRKVNENIDQAKAVVGHNSSYKCCVEVIILARKFAKACGHDQSEVCRHHAASALAVLKFASSHKLSQEAAIFQLEQIAMDVLKIAPSFSNVYAIGFHVILDSKKVSDFMKTLTSDGSNELMFRRMRELQENHDISTKWRGANNDRTLIEIFDSFRHMVQSIQNQISDSSIYNTQPFATLDYAAMSFADPWQFIFQCDIESTLRNAADIVRDFMQNAGISGEEAIDAYLESEIDSKVQILLKHGFQASIRDRLNGYPDSTSRILLKKKFLFMLENVENINWRTEAGADLVCHYFNEGMSGRCPDGVNAFCDNFILNLSLSRGNDVLSHLPNEYAMLIGSVATFFMAYKAWFKRMHLSRDKAHHEGRTVGDITMTYMLLLPLSLPGNFGIVKYPNYGHEGYVDSTQMKSEQVCKRYFNGGTLHFVHKHGTTDSIDIPKLDLAYIIQAFRKSIVRSEHGLERPIQPENPNLLPIPILDHSIDEKIIENCVKKDVLLGPYYQAAKAAEYTVDNLYFKSIEESDLSTESTTPLIVRIMRDAAIVRLFEICKYVQKSPDFDKRITSQWTCQPNTKPFQI